MYGDFRIVDYETADVFISNLHRRHLKDWNDGSLISFNRGFVESLTQVGDNCFISNWILTGKDCIKWIYKNRKRINKLFNMQWRDKKMGKMGNSFYKYYQPNKKDLKDECGDCSIRALTKYFGVEWLDIFDGLVKYSRITQFMPNNLTNIQKYLDDKCVPYVKCYNPKARHKTTVLDFAKAHKEGKYIIYCRVGYGTHLVCLDNGVYYDTWDCGDRIVYGYWGGIG